MGIARSKEIEECAIQEARNQEDVTRKQKDVQCQEQGNRRKCDTRVKEIEARTKQHLVKEPLSKFT
jgi:hypothetical protein